MYLIITKKYEFEYFSQIFFCEVRFLKVVTIDNRDFLNATLRCFVEIYQTFGGKNTGAKFMNAEAL